MSARVALAVLARYPTAGAVKTRLARTVGAERACALYAAFLRDLGARFADGPRPLTWMFHPPDSDFAALVGTDARCVPQSGRDLGERMHNCFRLLLADGFDKVLLIGADAPHVREEWLEEAETALDHADVVLGPTDDGGYYLIAMRAAHDVFSAIEMSTTRVLADTMAKAAAAGLRTHLVTPTFDIDEAGDLVRLQALLADPGAVNLPHTAAALKCPQ